ncbi:MAG: ribonuclease HIII [Melioribacteraceae bacterium]|nr:MAG: ribonuclease HIII [Melioribacteraceae bacterium]
MTDIFIKKQAETEIQNLYNKVSDSLQTTPIIEKDYHFEFSIKEEKNTIKVLVYFGKKGIKKVIQGTPSESLNYILNDGKTEEEIDEPDEYIGSDETGKGDVFGPLITCAFYTNKELTKKLKQLGVRDSKNLSDIQIKKISTGIKKLGNDNFEIIAINPEKYNELYARFRNINEILNWSHSKAIENLLSKVSAATIITDKFRKKDLKFSKKFDNDAYNIIQETKAEKYVAVAAASILAKQKQIEWFEQKKKEGIELKRGASNEVKLLIEKLIKEKDSESINKIAKLHFKTVKNLL